MPCTLLLPLACTRDMTHHDMRGRGASLQLAECRKRIGTEVSTRLISIAMQHTQGVCYASLVC